MARAWARHGALEARAYGTGIVLLDTSVQTDMRVTPLDEPIKTNGAVRCVAFSPDGSTIANGTGNNITLLEAATGKLRGQPLQGHSDYVYCVSFSPDGRTLVSGGGDKTIPQTWQAPSSWGLGQVLETTCGTNLFRCHRPDETKRRPLLGSLRCYLAMGPSPGDGALVRLKSLRSSSFRTAAINKRSHPWPVLVFRPHIFHRVLIMLHRGISDPGHVTSILNNDLYTAVRCSRRSLFFRGKSCLSHRSAHVRSTTCSNQVTGQKNNNNNKPLLGESPSSANLALHRKAPVPPIAKRPGATLRHTMTLCDDSTRTGRSATSTKYQSAHGGVRRPAREAQKVPAFFLTSEHCGKWTSGECIGIAPAAEKEYDGTKPQLPPMPE